MIIKYILFVFRNGFNTFRMAAHGSYKNNSDDLRAMYKEIMEDNSSDADKMRRDFLNVASDFRKVTSDIQKVIISGQDTNKHKDK